jgi:hypothetical protein
MKAFIPAEIGDLSRADLSGDPAVIEHLFFTHGSHVHEILFATFFSFRSLKTIVIPASAQVIAVYCFARRKFLRRVAFETGSTLRLLEAEAFFKCGCCSNEIDQQVDTVLMYFQSLPPDFARFPIDYELIRENLGRLSKSDAPRESIRIPASIETMDGDCFTYTTSFSSITFEADSK